MVNHLLTYPDIDRQSTGVVHWVGFAKAQREARTVKRSYYISWPPNLSPHNRLVFRRCSWRVTSPGFLMAWLTISLQAPTRYCRSRNELHKQYLCTVPYQKNIGKPEYVSLFGGYQAYMYFRRLRRDFNAMFWRIWTAWEESKKTSQAW
jgi:hypothetical protein